MKKSIKYTENNIIENNVNLWVVYKFNGNNSFSKEDIYLLVDFLIREWLFWEVIFQKINNTMHYYISIFYGKKWYANDVNQIDIKEKRKYFTNLLNNIPEFKDLKLVKDKWEIEWALKLLSLDRKGVSNKDVIETYFDKKISLQKQKNNPTFLRDNFSKYIKEDYSKYIDSILSGDYNLLKEKVIYDFDKRNWDLPSFSSESVNTMKILNNYLLDHKFIYPYLLVFKNKNRGKISYQHLKINELISFLNSKTGLDKKVNDYIFKISFTGDNSVTLNKKGDNETEIIHKGNNTLWNNKFFNIDSDNNIFLEYTFSLFLWVKKWNIADFLIDFKNKFQNDYYLKWYSEPSANEFVLSHNSFEWLNAKGSYLNLKEVFENIKEFPEVNKWGEYYGREYFSNNIIQLDDFQLVWKWAEWLPNADITTAILWQKWAWKTYITKKMFLSNKNQNCFLLTPVNNTVTEIADKNDDVLVLEFDDNFPNIIGIIWEGEVLKAQKITLFNVLFSTIKIEEEKKTIIEQIIWNFLNENRGKMFNINNFHKFIEKYREKGKFSDIIEIMDSIVLNNLNESMLTSEKVLLDFIKGYKKVIFWVESGWDNNAERVKGSIVLNAIKIYIISQYKHVKSKEDHDKIPDYMIYIDEFNVFTKYAWDSDWDQTAKQTSTMFYNSISEFIRVNRNKKTFFKLITQYMSDFNYKWLEDWTDKIINNFLILKSEQYSEFIWKFRNDKTIFPTREFRENFENTAGHIIQEVVKQENDKNLKDSWKNLRFAIIYRKDTQKYYFINTVS